MKKSERLAIIILGAAGFFFCVVPVFLRPEHYPSDDSFFYLQVASNIFGGYGATFNRITQTNGFHPLWQFCCAGFFFLTGGNKDSALLVVCIVQQLIFLGFIYYLWRLNEFLKLRYWYLAIPILMFYFLCTGLYASEAHLHCLLLLMLTCYFSREILAPRHVEKNWIGIGILCGLLFLARLDTVFILAVFALVGWWNLKKKGNSKYYMYLIYAATPALLIALPYLLYNYLSFGHLVPISGAIKSVFPHISANFDAIRGIGDAVTVAGIMGLTVGIYSNREKGRSLIYLLLSSGALLLSLYLFLFTDGNTRWPWYYISGILMLTFLFSHFFEFVVSSLFRKREAAKMIAAISLYTILMIFAGLRSWEKYSNGDSQGQSLWHVRGKTDRKWQIEVALWLKNNLPGHTKIFVYDWPGMIAYYSGMNILPADGLISNYQYNDDLKNVGITSYLQKAHVQFWLGQRGDHPEETLFYGTKMNSDSSQTVFINNPLYRIPAGNFTVKDENLVVDFRKTISNPLIPDISLWKIGEEPLSP